MSTFQWIPTCLATAVAGSLATCIAFSANAQDSRGGGTAAPSVASTPLTNAGDALLRSALDAAERGQFDTARFAGVSSNPAYGWVEFAQLRRDIDTLPAAQAQAFLQRYQGQPVAQLFREQWLASRARLSDWTAFQAAWSPDIQSTALRCSALSARAATAPVNPQWTTDAQAIWSSSGKPLPKECDAPMAQLSSSGGLTPAQRWARFDKASNEWQPAVMREAGDGLSGADFSLANSYTAFMQAPTATAVGGWPKTARSRLVASQGLARLAKANPAQAEALLPSVAQTLGFSDEDRGRVLYQAALWTVASYGPDSAQRMGAIPAVAMDERMHEWKVREALHRSDWKAALAAIRAMGPTQRSDSRWTYFEARLSELTGDGSGAQALYRKIASKADFHGFLAADKLQLPYTLCPWTLNDGVQMKSAIARDPSLVRALALFRAGRKPWAEREWRDALSRFNDAQRRTAVEVAQGAGWFDRGVFGLVNVGGKRYEDELRLYNLRFPLHHQDTIKREATKNRLDPAWVAAEIRAESIFDPNARSPANAMGLMQILPGTGAGVARKIGLPWGGANSLYDPDTNITLGSAYLRQLLDKYGQPYQVIAGYNAGPSPVNRWMSQRPDHDPAFWIETISYKETRDYVARVLAFSTMYDWRLNGDALPVSDRMLGVTGGKRKAFVCPNPAAPGPTPAATSSRTAR